MLDDEDFCVFDYVTVIAANKTSMLCEIDNEQVWIPRNQMLEGTDLEFKGDEGMLVIPSWLARQKDLA
jgi:hypothetical protein